MPAQELFASNWVNKLLEALKNRPHRSMKGHSFPTELSRVNHARVIRRCLRRSQNVHGNVACSRASASK
jgi:hypothetical protein